MQPDDRVALVCGGLENPGRAVAAELLKRGWQVAVQQDSGDVNTLAAELAQESGAGERLAAFCGDLREESQREALAEFVLDEFSLIDLLVCPPPQGRDMPAVDLLEVDAATLERAYASGVLGPMFIAQRVANEMIRLVESETIDGGKIVFLSSLTAYTTSVDQAPACLSGAGISMLNRLFADRLGEYGINVYEVRAGLMATRHGEPGHDKYGRLIEAGLTPIRRWGRPHDLALAVSAIAEDALGFSTGQVLDVDGGFHLRRL